MRSRSLPASGANSEKTNCDVGFYEVYCAGEAKLSNRLVPLSELLIRISRFGIAARGVIIVVIGFSLTRAAIRHDPSAARGTSGAFHQIGASSFGRLLLIIVGVGFATYGVYAFINARYRRIQVT